MPWPADYHMHTPLCRHATGEPSEMAAQAVKIGLGEIGFSDHSPMPRDDFDDWRMRAADLDAYVNKVDEARRAYPSLSIKVGLEVDFIPGCEQWVRDLAARHPWDYLIGSVHYVSEGWAVDNPATVSQWHQHQPDDVWKRYIDRLTLAVRSGLFDIIAHVDLCKKFRFYPAQEASALFREFMHTAQEHGVAIELNTGGLRKDCREIYPSPNILKLAAEMGVPITFGSDAHAPGEVGMNFENAVQLARDAGYTQWRRYTARQWELVAI